jgi:uncharacterized protein (DUF58 family)
MYFGSYLLQLFLIALLFPLLSVTLTTLAVRRFRFEQSRDQTVPVKGAELGWVLTLVNGSILPLHRVDVHFRTTTPLDRLAKVTAEPSDAARPDRADLRFFLKPRQRILRELRVDFPFRGRYTVGVESVVIADFLQLLRFTLTAAPSEFTVYPLIRDLKVLPAEASAGEGAPAQRFAQMLPDFTLFSHLREYRPGESLKHVSWKKFASRGTPLMREYESALDNSVRIVMDLRPPLNELGLSPAEKLTLEDTSVELLVALVRAFLSLGIRTSATAAGSEPIRFFGSRPEHFHDLYSATLGMTFHPSVFPAPTQEAASVQKSGATSIFITHRPDAEVQIAVDQAAASNQNVYVVMNQVVPAAGVKGVRGAEVLTVERPEDITTMFAGRSA